MGKLVRQHLINKSLKEQWTVRPKKRPTRGTERGGGGGAKFQLWKNFTTYSLGFIYRRVFDLKDLPPFKDLEKFH